MSNGQNSVVFEVGEFSPRSLGVTVHLPLSLGDLFPHFGAFLLSGETGEARYRYLAELLEKETDPHARFLILSYATFLPHELKHFHDFLASPYGATLMAENMLAAHYVWPVLGALGKEPTIGVPLQAWQDLSDMVHAVYCKQTQSGQFSRYPPVHTRRFTQAVGNIFARVKAWQGTPSMAAEASITTRQLLEGAAVDVQATQMVQLFGMECLVEFCQYLAQIDTEQTYTKTWALWDFVAQNMGKETEFSPAVRNAILFFMLCGTMQRKPEEIGAHPVTRLIALVGYMLDRGKAPQEDNILDYLNTWAEERGESSLEESLQNALEWSRQFAAGLRALARKNEEAIGHKIYPDDLFDSYDAWVGAQEHMVGQILLDPMSYFDNVKYLANMNRWVGAPVYVSTESAFFSEDNVMFDEFRRSGWQVVWAEGDADGGVSPQGRLVYGPELTIGQPALPRETAAFLSTQIWMTYLLWSKGMLSPIHRQVAAAVIRGAVPHIEVLML